MFPRRSHVPAPVTLGLRIAVAISLLAPTALRAQGQRSRHVRDGAWVARHIEAEFDSLPPAWVSRQNVMDDIWTPLGLRGVNFYAYGGPVAPHAFASRSDPSSPSYQAWFGVYVVVGRKAVEHGMPMRLGALDQRSWLRAMGDPAPAFTLIDSRAIGTISVASTTRPLYAWSADTHSDLGPGATPLAAALGMPPASDWPRGLRAFHGVRLRGYYSSWYDAAHDVSVVVYACAAGFDVGTDRRDNFAALDGAMLRMMRTVRLAPALPPLIRVVAHEYAFQAPDTVQAGPTTFRLVSHGKEPHVMPIVRIAAGHTGGELYDAIVHHAPTPWITSLGGVGTVAPGDSATSIVDLSPGLYATWCDLTGKDSVPHFMKGMFHAFTVVGPPNGAAMPPADVSLELSEYAFGMPDTLSAGKHVIEVRNVGTQPHMALLWRFNPGVSADSVMRWIIDPALRTDHPITYLGGVPDVSPGQRVQMVVDLPPGRYMLICLDDDVHDHKPHFMHGMVREVEVVPAGTGRPPHRAADVRPPASRRTSHGARRRQSNEAGPQCGRGRHGQLWEGRHDGIERTPQRRLDAEHAARSGRRRSAVSRRDAGGVAGRGRSARRARTRRLC